MKEKFDSLKSGDLFCLKYKGYLGEVFFFAICISNHKSDYIVFEPLNKKEDLKKIFNLCSGQRNNSRIAYYRFYPLIIYSRIKKFVILNRKK